jgi:ADP-ribose pyrophosphatase YjhB (NUDIX family)
MRQPYVVARDGRRFACRPIGALVFVVDDHGRTLLLCDPRAPGAWCVPGGAIEHGETVLAGAWREAKEELGGEIALRPIGVVHTHSFTYEPELPLLVSVSYLFAFEGGTIEPGSDLAGARFRWCTLTELEDEANRISVPKGQRWLFRRAVELHRLYRNAQVGLEKSG